MSVIFHCLNAKDGEIIALSSMKKQKSYNMCSAD